MELSDVRQLSRLGIVKGPLLVVVACLAIGAGAQTPFKRRFAPEEGKVAPIEKPTRDERCLNGKWQFQPVANDLPMPESSRWEKVPIRIPSPWNVNAFPVESRLGGDFRCFPSYPQSWEKVQAGWLRRPFEVPTVWRGKRLILRFDAVAGDTRVLVNGKEVARHFDLFLPFEVDVTDAVHAGSNELLVGVKKASLTDVQGKYGRRTYQGGSMWGQAIAGIWQDVTLLARPVVSIDDVFVKPDMDNDILAAEVTLRNDSAMPKRLSLDGEVLPWINKAGSSTLDSPEPRSALGPRVLKMDRRMTGRNGIVVPAHGTVIASLAVKVANRLKPWAPGSPNLYSLVCHLGGDVKATRFGWRQLSFEGTKVLLNGKPLIMRGDSWHFLGIPQMTRRYAWAWFKTLQDAGLNAVRLHAEPYPSFYLDMADEMGILVLDETAVWASDGGPKLDDPAYWADTQRHLTDLIHRDRNHPSVFGWSVSNEVMAVVRNVFHAPKEVEDQANRMNGVWAAICRKEDPTRVWISADGEEDGNGQLPVSVIHYGDRSTMNRAIARNKPWGVGEAGPAYYGSPKQIAEMAKDPGAYLSFADRMRGVAKVSYASLKDQNDLDSGYRSVFNLVWYGLEPLALGLSDTTRPPALTDGISFPPYVEGQPGVQPERLGPYCSTLNPGYDPRLPLYEAWPLFDAIKAAARNQPVNFDAPVYDFGTARRDGPIQSVRVLAGPGGKLATALADLGATVTDDAKMIFVDGANPPGQEAKPILDRALAEGDAVVVWCADKKTLPALNALLPKPLTLTSRDSSSLIAAADLLTAGLSPSSLYFSETEAPNVLPAGLDGPLLQGAKVVLRASDADWRRWNNQGETVKTAMILRSEREAKPSGTALAVVSVGKGRLIISGLAPSESSPAAALERTILRNLGLSLQDNRGSRNMLAADGLVPVVLALGPFITDSIRAATRLNIVRPDLEISVNQKMLGRNWERVASVAGNLPVTDQGDVSFTFLTFRVYSPKPLDNLLLDPHLPTVGLQVSGADATQVWLEGKPVEGPLLLKQGWSRVLIKVIRNNRPENPSVRFTSNQPEFLEQLRVSVSAQ